MIRKTTAPPRKFDIVDEFLTAVKDTMHRKQIGVTELSRNANVGRQYLYRILSGESVPTLEKARDIAAALGLRIKITNLK